MADLISLNDYKDLEGITSNQHDARTEVIIDSVSQLVKTYCGNSIIDFYSTNKTELIFYAVRHVFFELVLPLSIFVGVILTLFVDWIWIPISSVNRESSPSLVKVKQALIE